MIIMRGREEICRASFLLYVKNDTQEKDGVSRRSSAKNRGWITLIMKRKTKNKELMQFSILIKKDRVL
jgi:hypothetical protein